jgi:uncharacterized protein (TIGR03118 family)
MIGRLWRGIIRPFTNNSIRQTRPSRPRRLDAEQLEERCTPAIGFLQTNLVSDISGMAAVTDTNLKNPWGISNAPGGPFWISDNATGLTTVYDGSGQNQNINVTIPGRPAGTTGTPTGTVYNAGAGFGGNIFLFDSEDGTISGWAGAASTTIEVDNSANPTAAMGAVYKGLAMGTDSSNRTLLYATNFRAATIDIFDSSFHAATVSGGFTDPNLPSGFAPFNIQNLGGKLYVTYAKQDAAKHDDVAGPGLGVVDVFNTDGVLQQTIATGGTLNSPWGLAIAPAGFGPYGGDLLVGNFGDGRISVFNSSGQLQGQLSDGTGNPISIDGLWDLQFGGGGSSGDAQSLYFTAGLNGEADGLLGSLTVIQAPDLTVAMSHTGNFTQNDPADQYTVTVTNSGNAATSGTVTVTDVLPTGLTPTAADNATANGWTLMFSGQTITATRSDPLLPNTAYAPLTITVAVAGNAPASVTNMATVAGGGETNTSNDGASDPTTINSSVVLPTSSVTALHAFSKPTFTVSWSGTDTGGPGIASYSVFVSDNGGAFTPFITNTTQTSATFHGTAEHTYGFYSVATDSASNVQPTPATAQATTQTMLDTSSKEYVAAVYISLLKRDVDLGGLLFWAGRLDNHAERSVIAAQLTHSAEYYQTNVIKPAYLQFLGRSADQAGLTFWTGELQGGMTDEQMQAGFIASVEFYNNANGGTSVPVTPAHDRAWVIALYTALLGRGPDQAGEDFWTNELQGALSRIQVANGFTGSQEGLSVRVNQTYLRYLGRPADNAGLAFWLTEYHMGAINEDIVTGFISSDEFFAAATM